MIEKTYTMDEIFNTLNTILCDTDEEILLDEAIRETAKICGCSFTDVGAAVIQYTSQMTY